ncbi:MAG: DUF3500 domain-containing protein [Gemmataceae bacterium]
MKRILQASSVAILVGLVWLSQSSSGAGTKDPSRSAAVKFFESLSDEQKKQAVLPYDSKDKYAENFPEVKRPGIPWAALKPEQKKLAEAVIVAMTSEYGGKRCLQVSKQSSEGGRYVTFYGEPSADKPFAWRVASHHLTLVYAEFSKAEEFGPILLGGNPVKDLWDDEDKIAQELYAALTPEEVKSVQGKGANAGSGSAIGKAGARVGDLNEKARAQARKLFEKRLEVFAADRRALMENILKAEGGVDNLRLAVWGSIAKSFKESSYSWRLGNERITCDWQTVGKEHLHLCVKAKAKG